MALTSVDLGVVVGGLITGFAFQRSRLCFVSAFRDLYLFRALGMTRAVLVLAALVSIGGAGVVLQKSAQGLPLPELLGPTPLAAGVGGFVFGVGMILAGSCPSGACWRFGEGQLSQLPILGGLLAGTWLYVFLPVLDEQVKLNRVDWWLPVAIALLAVLVIVWWELRHPGPGKELPLATDKGIRAPWAAEVGAWVIAFALVTFLALYSRTWTVTRAFMLTDQEGLLFVLGLFAGGFAGARFGREWRLRSAGTTRDRRLRFAGGLLMGYGARIGAGCTVGLFLGGLAVLSPLPWYWLGGAIIGTAGGAAILYRHISR